MDMKFNTEVLNKVLLESKITNIKSNSIKKWATNFMSLKNILCRTLTIILSSIIFCVIYFVLRQKGLDGAYGNPVFNKGSAFGSGADWDGWTIYLIKSLVAILFFISFFIFNKWYCYIPLWCVFINALCIIIDKSIVVPEIYVLRYYPHHIDYRFDTVVDYFHFSTFVNNIGDIFIIIFACVSVLSITVFLIKSDWFKENNDNDHKEITNV